MIRTSRDEMLKAFAQLSKSDRPIFRIANSKKNNSADDYGSDKLLERSEATAKERVKRSLTVLGKFGGRAL